MVRITRKGVGYISRNGHMSLILWFRVMNQCCNVYTTEPLHIKHFQHCPRIAAFREPVMEDLMLAYLERLRLIGFSTVVGVLSAQIIGSTGEDGNLADESHSLDKEHLLTFGFFCDPLKWFM